MYEYNVPTVLLSVPWRFSKYKIVNIVIACFYKISPILVLKILSKSLFILLTFSVMGRFLCATPLDGENPPNLIVMSKTTSG
jgi:hypothetical protein